MYVLFKKLNYDILGKLKVTLGVMELSWQLEQNTKPHKQRIDHLEISDRGYVQPHLMLQLNDLCPHDMAALRIYPQVQFDIILI